MRQEMLQPFQGKYVKIVLKPNYFALFGTIDIIYEDAILFTTSQKTSLISFSKIQEVTPHVDKHRRSNE